MKLNGILFETTNQSINQSQLSIGHKSLPRYSNLKLKPNLQADVVMFKGKENVLSQEQKALNNLNALLKQNIITPELNTFLIKEVNSKNKNVIKYLNEIKASNDPNLKGHKAVAERLVANHSQLSGAIASMKSVDDETKQKLDLDNQKRMVHGINEIYTKDKDVKTEETNGEIGFGGRKDRAKKIVNVHAGIAAGIGAACAQVPLLDIVPLKLNEKAMVFNIGKEYGINLGQNWLDGEVVGDFGEAFGAPASEALRDTLTTLVSESAKEIAKELGKEAGKAILGMIPFVGNAVNGTVAYGITKTLGESVIRIYQQQTGYYD